MKNYKPIITREMVNDCIARVTGKDPETLTDQERFEALITAMLQYNPTKRKEAQCDKALERLKTA